MTMQTYGVHYRDFHTAIPGLLIFQKKEEAERAFHILDNDESEDKERDAGEVFESAYAQIDAVNGRNGLPETMEASYEINENGNVSIETSTCHILNPDMSVDVY